MKQPLHMLASPAHAHESFSAFMRLALSRATFLCSWRKILIFERLPEINFPTPRRGKIDFWQAFKIKFLARSSELPAEIASKCLAWILIILFSLAGAGLQAQEGSQGMRFQAQARDIGGRILANERVAVRIGFSSRDGEPTTYYSEEHQVSTGAMGLFEVVVGAGKPVSGTLAEVPWAERQIWMDVELKSAHRAGFELNSSTRLRAVPYAFYAQTANELANTAAEKNQSIRWTTSGNSDTRPPTHFIGTQDQQDLVIKTNNVERMIITKEGQFRYVGGVPTGPDNLITSYPMIVRGSRQGIHIRVNESRTGANNFLTFGDTEGDIWGAVEGQKFYELEAYWRYQLQVAVYALQGATLVASGVAVTVKSGGLAAAIVCAAVSIIFAIRIPGLAVEAAGAAIAAAVVIIQSAALINEGVEWGNGIRRDIGVTYSTGAADYAEWLERLPAERDLEQGEIVGVKGGKVSLNTQEADHLMVISTLPFFLGNAPQPDQEHLYEKVAFMGQVPVRVMGPVEAGDYILPSGNNDGLGVAVNPGKMHLADFAHVVGVAWESSTGNQPVHQINMGVGLNSNNALAPKVEEISRRVENIIAYLEGKESLIPGNSALSSLVASSGRQAAVPAGKLMTDAEFDQLMDANAAELRSFSISLEQQLREQGADLPESPELQEFFRDPLPKLKAMRRDPAMARHWGLLDQELLKIKQ